jgi:hypothetical protein
MSNATGAEQPIWPPELPESLYRYDTAESAAKILRDGTLMFSSRRRFNDPFDCRVRPTFAGSREGLALYLAKRREPKASPDRLRSMVREVIDRITPEACDEVFKRWETNILDNSGIICLSEIRDDILMWSHYAEQHKGVCLEFRFEATASLFDLPLPVDYRQHYPEFDFAEQFSKVSTLAAERKAMREFGRMVFLTKSCHWNYEKEWRVIRMALDEQPKFGSSTFPPQLLTGLILGCGMREDERRALIELASAHEPRLRIFEAIPRDREFALDIRQIG